MAHNLKKFSTEADYSAATLNYPAVSWVTGTNSVHFKIYPDEAPNESGSEPQIPIIDPDLPPDN